MDDDIVYGVAAIEVLEHAGYEALLVSTGHAAMTAFTQMRPDLILLDVELPDANGFDLCARLRSTAAGTDIPIVMVTGHDNTESITRAFQAGAADFINKPILWATLPHRIEFMLRAYADMRALRLSEQRNLALLQALPDTLLIVDCNGHILEHFTGEENATRNNYAGKMLDDVLPSENARTAMESLRSAIDTGVAQSYEFDIGSGDTQKAFEARMRPQPNGTVLIVLRDATERRRSEARIQYLAYYDTLTGLPNRQLFVRELRRALRPRWRCCIWTWTDSSASMTISAIRSATPCCNKWHDASKAAFGRPTWLPPRVPATALITRASRDSAATNSSFF